MIRRTVIAVAALMLVAALAPAGSFYDPAAAGFTPRVPVSLLGSMSSRFDPTRLHMSSTLSFGTGFGGGSSGLQTTSFSYQFRSPLSVNVSVGNAFGANTASGSSFFLQGLDVTYHPTANSVFRIEYQNVRSPLQYGYGRGYGYGPFGY